MSEELVDRILGPEETEEPEEEVEEVEEAEEEPEKEPEPEEPTADEKLVPLAALHEARQEVKAMREELRQLREAQTKPKEEEPEEEPVNLDELDEDDLITVKQLKQLQRREAQVKARTVQEQIGEAEAAFMEAHSKDSAPEGLDAETVFQTGSENLSVADKKQAEKLIAAGKADRAVEFVYKRCIERTPSLLLKQYQSEQESAAEQTKPAKVAATPKRRRKPTVTEIKSASDQLIEDLLGPEEEDED